MAKFSQSILCCNRYLITNVRSIYFMKHNDPYLHMGYAKKSMVVLPITYQIEDYYEFTLKLFYVILFKKQQIRFLWHTSRESRVNFRFRNYRDGDY